MLHRPFWIEGCHVSPRKLPEQNYAAIVARISSFCTEKADKFSRAQPGTPQIHLMYAAGTLNAMQAFSLALAAMFSLIAIVLAFMNVPKWVAIALLAAAAVFLFLGLREKYNALSAAGDAPIELDDEQRETVRRLKGEGREDSAIRQVQLWFRNTDYEAASAVVRGVV